MSEDTELLVNLRNGQRAERLVTRNANMQAEHAAAVAAEMNRRQALARLQARALGDEVVADLLTVLGLA
jgi:hypothetical protein